MSKEDKTVANAIYLTLDKSKVQKAQRLAEQYLAAIEKANSLADELTSIGIELRQTTLS
ncbi:hypothetical protein [Lacticaseibacillus suibinensis]|uniref:hypothetical protein n=1 Tax=Lacticaseibacillus suibinensis TaxID=2486011 RepID=UPI0013DD914C|nr:hypothetical protein [Lacticaseibacillus suibinensis]